MLCRVALANSSTSKIFNESTYFCEHARSFSTNVNAVGMEVSVTMYVYVCMSLPGKRIDRIKNKNDLYAISTEAVK